MYKRMTADSPVEMTSRRAKDVRTEVRSVAGQHPFGVPNGRRRRGGGHVEEEEEDYFDYDDDDRYDDRSFLPRVVEDRRHNNNGRRRRDDGSRGRRGGGRDRLSPSSSRDSLSSPASSRGSTTSTIAFPPLLSPSGGGGGGAMSEERIPEMIRAFDRIIADPVRNYLRTSSQLGSEVFRQAEMVEGVFEVMNKKCAHMQCDTKYTQKTATFGKFEASG